MKENTNQSDKITALLKILNKIKKINKKLS